MATKQRAISISGAVHEIQLSLLDGVSSSDHLLAAGSLLSRSDYEDVVIERSISNLCGYPLCGISLPSDRPRKGRYRISLREHKVYDLEETYKYCSDDCVVSSRAFSESLDTERCSDSTSEKVEQILGLFRRSDDRDGLGRKFSDLTIQVRKDLGKGGDLGFSNLMIQEKKDVKDAEVKLTEWIGPSNAIEGYIPKQDRNQGTKFKSKPKSTQLIDDTESSGMGFTSEIIMEDQINVVSVKTSSVQARDGSELIVKKSVYDNKNKEVDFKSTVIIEDDGVQAQRMSSTETALKSSLKTSGSRVEGRTVTWADEKKTEVLGDRKDGLESTGSSQELHEEDLDSSLRFASAEACAIALTQAAETIASGGSEAMDAVSEAGLVILPHPDDDEERDSEADEDLFELDRGVVRWPKKPVLLDTDMFDVEDSWHDTPPEGFSLTLSSFATMWMALFGWITCSSLAYIYGRDESSQDDFLSINGREYPYKIVLSDGRSSEIKQTIAGCIARILLELVTDLTLPTPVYTMEKAMGRLLDTMSFVDPVPPFNTKQWNVIVLLFLDALSVHRLVALTPHMTRRSILLHKVLSAAEVSGEEYETMRDLMIPLGRLPQFSMQSGG